MGSMAWFDHDKEEKGARPKVMDGLRLDLGIERPWRLTYGESAAAGLGWAVARWGFGTTMEEVSRPEEGELRQDLGGAKA